MKLWIPTKDTMDELIATDVHGDSNNVVTQLQPTLKSDDVADSAWNNVSKTIEPVMSSLSDCILLNAISMPIAVVEQVPDVQIINPVVATPLHAFARQWRWAYEHNRH
jgi:hypothetical protein